jgi:hypothetical protein
MPLEMSGQVELDDSPKSSHRRMDGRMSLLSLCRRQGRGWLPAPLLQAIGCSKTNLSARLKIPKFVSPVTGPRRMPRPRCNLLPKAATGGATTSLCGIATSPSFEAMVVADGGATIFGDHVKWRFLFVRRGRAACVGLSASAMDAVAGNPVG